MLAVGKHLVLARQVGPTRIHQVDARQGVLRGDGLRPQVLLHGERVIAAALHGRIIGDDHAFLAADPPDPGDDPGGRHIVVVDTESRERGQFQERRTRVEQRIDALARQQLAPSEVQFAGAFTAPETRGLEMRPQIIDLGLHRGAILREFGAADIDGSLDHVHDSFRCRLSGFR